MTSKLNKELVKTLKYFAKVISGVCPHCNCSLDIMRYNGIQHAVGLKDYQNCTECGHNYKLFT
jgi:uncharacterized protein with PIN domain